MYERLEYDQIHSELKYIFLCLSALRVNVAECVHVNVCHHSWRCLMSADRCLICASLSLKQTFHQHNGSFQPLVHTETPTDKLHKPNNICKLDKDRHAFIHIPILWLPNKCNKHTPVRMHVLFISVFVGVKVGRMGWRAGEFALQTEEHASSVYCPLWVKWFLTTPKWSPGGGVACS